MKAQVYLDHNATSPLRPEAREAMITALDWQGIPSSLHAQGRAARGMIEDVRERIAARFGKKGTSVFFTSGGTEAANTVLRLAEDAPVVFMGATEHVCVLQGHALDEERVRQIEVDARGVAVLPQFEPGPIVALQAANNETGVIQPITQISQAAKQAGAIFICDAVQAIGRLPLEILKAADISFFSGHKFGGPKGAGAVVLLRDGLAPKPLLKGGGQEHRWRSGTENAAAIAGLGAAFEVAVSSQETETVRLQALRDELERGILAAAPEAVIFGAEASRLCNTTCFTVPGLGADLLLIAFDLEGIAISSGSACSSGKVERSHVLAAMGVETELSRGAIRVSLGWTTRQADIETFLTRFKKILSGRRSPRHAA